MSSQKKRSPKDGPVIKAGSSGARRTGALVLEVLSGERTPAEAAQVLGVGLPRYYQIEKQALDGLILACEPREKGRRQKSPQSLLQEKEQERRRLERDLHRTQALLRASQKAVGLMAAVRKDSPSGRKRRTPQVRALKIARSLTRDSGSTEETASGDQNPVSTPAVESVT